MRSENSLKINEHQALDDLIADFFSKGGQIESVPSSVYKREEITVANRRTILETSKSKVKSDGKKSGHALKEANRIAWEKAKIERGMQ